MTRILLLSLLVGSAPALGGCVAGMAVSAASMAIRSAQGQPQSNAHLKPAARNDCSVYAARFGAVHIIDVQQRSPSKLIVWGTVDDGKERRSFECAYGTSITGFKLRAIPR
jgi:hypothetical protein